MKILGIDPGIGRMGWGVIEAKGSKMTPLGFGCVETFPKNTVPERLFILHEKLKEIIKEFKPETMGIEELFFAKNAKTAFVVGQARGVILLTAEQEDLSIGIYTPLQVKIAVTGYGKAEKQQVGHMVKTLLGLKTVPKPDDTADALAIALTHAFSKKKYE